MIGYGYLPTGDDGKNNNGCADFLFTFILLTVVLIIGLLFVSIVGS